MPRSYPGRRTRNRSLRCFWSKWFARRMQGYYYILLYSLYMRMYNRRIKYLSLWSRFTKYLSASISLRWNNVHRIPTWLFTMKSCSIINLNSNARKVSSASKLPSYPENTFSSIGLETLFNRSPWIFKSQDKSIGYLKQCLISCLIAQSFFKSDDSCLSIKQWAARATEVSVINEGEINDSLLLQVESNRFILKGFVGAFPAFISAFL